MKDLLTKLFWPILNFFEAEEETNNYQKSHRFILNIVGSLFVMLSLALGGVALVSGQLGAIIPMVVFFCVGAVAVIVGSLGSNSAVCKIWGSK